MMITVFCLCFLQTKNLVRLSQQNLMDCSWGFGNNGCDGGEEFRSYQWVMKHGGIATEQSYGQYLAQVRVYSKFLTFGRVVSSFTYNFVSTLYLGWVLSQRDHRCKDFKLCERNLGRP